MKGECISTRKKKRTTKEEEEVKEGTHLLSHVATLMNAMRHHRCEFSVGRSVGRSIGWLVGLLIGCLVGWLIQKGNRQKENTHDKCERIMENERDLE